MIRIKSLNESSLSRIWQHVQNPGRSFGVVSAFDADNFDRSENMERHEELKDIVLNEMGYGYIEFEGGYTGEDVDKCLEKAEELEYFEVKDGIYY